MGCSPGGFLTGKYTPNIQDTRGHFRLNGNNPFQGGFTKFTEQNWHILAALRAVSAQVGRPLAQVALAWLSAKPGITAILGASTLEQLQDNVSSLDVQLLAELSKTLDDASASTAGVPFFTPNLKRMIFGGTSVEGWR